MTRSRRGLFAWLALLVLLAVLAPFVWKSGDASDATPAAATAEESSARATELADAANLAREEARKTSEATSMPYVAALAELEVREADGAAVSDATVLACRAGELVWREQTDASGRLSVAADGAELLLVVSAAGYPLVAQSLALTPGAHVLELPTGERVAGSIVFGDGARAAALKLVLDSDHALPASASIPESVFTALSIRPGNRARIAAETDPSGRFEFRALPPDWSGGLFVPYPYQIQGTSVGTVDAASRRVRLEHAVSELSIELAATLRGRLLDAARAPVAELVFGARMTIEGQARGTWAIAVTDRSGRFAFEQPEGTLRHVALGLDPARAEFWVFHEADLLELPRDLELGVIVLPPLRDLHFVVQDPAGVRVVGAVAQVGGQRCTPTDEQGAGTVLHVSPSTRELRVVADGFLPANVPIDERTPDPFVVVLEPSNRLTVRVVVPTATSYSSLFAVLSCVEGLFAESEVAKVETSTTSDHVSNPSPLPHKTDPANGVVTAAGRCNEIGEVVFQALRSGAELELRITGSAGQPVHDTRRIAPLGPTESRTETIDLGSAMRVFRGRVVDLDGRAIVGAFVQFGDKARAHTDTNGDFTLTLGEERVARLVLDRDGYATLVDEVFAVPDEPAPVEFRLVPERRVAITVMDADGGLVTDAEVAIRRGTLERYAQTVAPGRYEATGLSDQIFAIDVYLPGHRHSEDHDPRVPEARVVLPRPGRVIVEWSTPLAHAGEGEFLFKLRARDQVEPFEVNVTLRAAGQTRCEFARVYPGDYLLEHWWVPSRAASLSGARNELRAERIPVHVDPGAEAHMTVPGP
ncbi:MAG: carboxypeptidase regulatory-like domain-containing protein [Planctomycetes bacterium]|nr:carboxypeptidase regulatory-like domain-containing protein [Planctomycetota bacterium]